MTKVENHKRENDILLGFLERPALNWLAAHMPPWVTPDILTWLGILASILIFISYALTNVSKYFLILASLGFVLNWFGDSLDGTLARYRHIERPRYGFLIDHYVDAISSVLIFVGLGLSPYVDLTVASMGAIAYLLVSIMVYLITYVTGVFQITNAKIGPTEIRLIAIISNIGMLIFGNPKVNLPVFGPTNLYTLIVGLVALIMTLYFLFNTSIQARKLKILDEKRLERKQEKLKDAAESNERNEPSSAVGEV
ncbi:MAG: CDP-alcohol phosphatidyltransferase family protein [Chloroflexota bacterium]|nr:CDP-alcohol phosphatidyltransferase family protein [Chloroflexota bacterium]